MSYSMLEVLASIWRAQGSIELSTKPSVTGLGKPNGSAIVLKGDLFEDGMFSMADTTKDIPNLVSREQWFIC